MLDDDITISDLSNHFVGGSIVVGLFGSWFVVIGKEEGRSAKC